jgi:hypothetical protein
VVSYARYNGTHFEYVCFEGVGLFVCCVGLMGCSRCCGLENEFCFSCCGVREESLERKDERGDIYSEFLYLIL